MGGLASPTPVTQPTAQVRLPPVSTGFKGNLVQGRWAGWVVGLKGRSPRELSSQLGFWPFVVTSADVAQALGAGELQALKLIMSASCVYPALPMRTLSFSPPLTDSVVSASREIAAFFPDFSEQRWYEQEEPQLRCGPVHYSPEGGIHFAAPAGGPGPA